MARRARDRALPPRRILLIGMMASGKTTIGRELSARTGWPYVDNDQLLVQATGRSAKELLEERGVSELRAGEASVVARALELAPPVIVGIAAGVILDPGARELLRNAGIVVWLRAGPETLISRLRSDVERPWMGGDMPGWVRREAERRAPLYAEVATHVVDVDSGAAGQAAERILDDLERDDR